jgi:hypothetical protein
MNKETEQAIREHGQNLLAIFPNAAEGDPIRLCKKLRRLEREAHDQAERWCNGTNEYDEAEHERRIDAILGRVNVLLGNTGAKAVSVFVNTDPRGCALKIERDWMVGRPALSLRRDWGNYGLIAPDLTQAE